MENNLFDDWNSIKKKLHSSNNLPNFSEGEIWWCGVGKNIGVEVNGKSKVFSRPVLIFRKLNRYCFLAVPLTSKPKAGTWYVNFNFRGDTDAASLVQIKIMSTSRLYSRIGEIDELDFERIQDGFGKLFIKNFPKP